MKLATLMDGSRDGHLVVVSDDGRLAHHASGIAHRLQAVLDDWNFLAPQLEDLARTLNQGKARHAFAFDPRAALAPLPRAAARWRGDGDDAMPVAADDLRGPGDPEPVPPGPWHARLVAVVGELPRGASPAQALDAVRLLMLCADAPPTDDSADAPPRFAPLAVTPDRLGAAWAAGAGAGLVWTGPGTGRLAAPDLAAADLGGRIAAACVRRRLRSGALVDSGLIGRLPGPGFGLADALREDLFGAVTAPLAGSDGPAAPAPNDAAPHTDTPGADATDTAAAPATDAP